MVQVFADDRPKKQARRPDIERVTYLGYPILICASHLTIHTPDGAQLVSARMELSTARATIRRHRLDKRLAEIKKEALA